MGRVGHFALDQTKYSYLAILCDNSFVGLQHVNMCAKLECKTKLSVSSLTSKCIHAFLLVFLSCMTAEGRVVYIITF